MRASWSIALALLLWFGGAARADQALYDAERARIKAARLQQLTALLDEQLLAAREGLADRQRARNPTGIASFSEAIRLIEAAQRDLKNKGAFDALESRRRSLDEMLGAINTARENALAEYEAALSGLNEQYPDAAAAFAARPKAPPRPSARIANPALEAAPPAAVTARPPDSATAPMPTPGEIQLSLPQGPALPENVIAQRGESTNWVPVGRWTATMKSEAIIGLQVFNRQAMVTGSYYNPIEMVYSDWKYEALRWIPPGGYPMRLVHLPNHAPITLDQWPTPDGRRDLTIRVRFARWPLTAGFQLEADGAALPPPPAQIRIPVRTLPPGARVLVDGVEITADGSPVETPCEIVLAEGARHEIRLRRDGMKEALAPSFLVTPGARIQWRFEPAP